MRPSWFKTEEDRGQRTEDRSLSPASSAGQSLQAVSREQRGRSFIDKTLSGITGFLKDAIFTSEWIRKNGFLQGIEPKSKLLGILLFIITISIVKEIYILLSFYAFSVILAGASSIGIIAFIRRVWLFIPLFAGLIAIPAVFLTHGEPILFFFGFAITKQGVSAAITFVLRVAASVSFIVLLILTTKWDHIMKALRVFRIPAVFILILSMTYRYIYLLLSTIEDMYFALLSRTIKGQNRKDGQKWAAGRIGFLFQKSRRLSEDVYDAMVSRGFDGEVRVMDSFRMKALDYIWIGFAFGIFIGVQIENFRG